MHEPVTANKRGKVRNKGNHSSDDVILKETPAGTKIIQPYFLYWKEDIQNQRKQERAQKAKGAISKL